MLIYLAASMECSESLYVVTSSVCAYIITSPTAFSEDVTKPAACIF